jgi:hypothetical protein
MRWWIPLERSVSGGAKQCTDERWGAPREATAGADITVEWPGQQMQGHPPSQGPSSLPSGQGTPSAWWTEEASALCDDSNAVATVGAAIIQAKTASIIAERRRFFIMFFCRCDYVLDLLVFSLLYLFKCNNDVCGYQDGPRVEGKMCGLCESESTCASTPDSMMSPLDILSCSSA